MKWAVLLLVLLSASCAKKAEKEAEAVAPVQTAEVRTDSIRRVFEADGILYPRNQASVVPKISAPVRTFYVNRGDRVREGQLLALLENRDLAAATQESKGQFDQAEANYRSTTAAAVPEQVVKAQTDAQAGKEAMDAAKKVYESRQKLFQEGALARKLVDDAQVAFVQARSQYQAAEQHLANAVPPLARTASRIRKSPSGLGTRNPAATVEAFSQNWLRVSPRSNARTTGWQPSTCTAIIFGRLPPIQPNASISSNAFHIPIMPTPPPVG